MTTQSSIEGLEGLRPKWGWFLVLGISLIVLGAVALAAPWLATLTSVLLYGWLLVFGGVFEVVAAFWAKERRGIFLHLLGGLLSAVVGTLIVTHPEAGVEALTLLLATLFLAGGLFRAGAAVVLRFPSWGWAAVGGLVSAFLGVFVWRAFPVSALWLIGTLVAIELLLRGWAWVMFALAGRQIWKPAEALFGRTMQHGT